MFVSRTSIDAKPSAIDTGVRRTIRAGSDDPLPSTLWQGTWIIDDDWGRGCRVLQLATYLESSIDEFIGSPGAELLAAIMLAAFAAF